RVFAASTSTDARNGLGRMALAITNEVNAQHRLGIDLNGAAGGDFFKPIALPDAVADSGNAGNAVLGVAVSDSTALVASAYRIEIGSGGALEVTRLSDQKRTSFAGPLPIQIDGLRIAASSGSAATGDSYVLQPYADAAGAMAMALSSPREVAAANPVQARVGAGNVGSLAVAGLSVKSATANLGAPVTLTFTSSGTFDVSGTGTGNPTGQSFAPGQTIAFNGWNVTLNGTPKAGDTLTIEPASAAYSSLNAGNAGALLALRDKPVFDGAAMTDGYAGLMAQVGVRAQSAQYAAQVSTSIATTSETERTGVAGVNLDEEAAKLLQYQQSYQAAAKMIQLSQNLFDSVLQGMR
ncbi:MAG: flagellar hook-associated protein FlgK, partial [Comamonadaceae bacterium]